MSATTTEMDWPTLPAPLRQRIGFASTNRAEQPGQSVYALNFGLHVGDDAQNVLVRRRALADAHGITPVWMSQVHGTECVWLSQAADDSHTDAVTADAAWTTSSGLAPLIMTADCLPVLLTDHEGRAVAAAHCGWRGLLDGVLQNTIGHFEAAGFLDGPLHAWLGPCIGPKSFEVGREVREAFLDKNSALQAFFTPGGADQPGKWLADLQAIATRVLNERCQTVTFADTRDTFRDPMLHSYRRDKVTGRQASLIWIRADSPQHSGAGR